MSDTFKVVTDVGEIGRLNRRLAERLAERFRFGESRVITWPSDKRVADVRFESEFGTNVRAWEGRTTSGKHENYMLFGAPLTSEALEITLQLNFPADEYNRMIAGVFVFDAADDVFIAHRGRLTKGRAGLPIAKVLREFSAQTVDAYDDGKTSTVILIAAVEEDALVDRLWDFATDARDVATRLAIELHGTGVSAGSSTPSDGRSRTGQQGARSAASVEKKMLKLRAYFDEYTGQGHTKGHGGGIRTVEHGAVVKALEALARGMGVTQKSQAIDLSAVAPSEVRLFEVKTSSRTTDVYTGVGQLLVNGAIIGELLNMPVKRYLVLPEMLDAKHVRHLSQAADTRVVYYVKVGRDYRFSSLE